MYKFIAWLKSFWTRAEFAASAVVNRPLGHQTFVVILVDGRVGVLDHQKSDGKFGVRPLDVNGNYMPNTSTHWPMADRIRIPEELALSPDEFRPALPTEIPASLRS